MSDAAVAEHVLQVRELATWSDGAAFLEDYQKSESGSVVSLPAHFGAYVKEGNLIAFVIRFASEEAQFRVHARVTQITVGRVEVTLLSEERTREALIVACARGESIPYIRGREPRIPCSFPVVVSDGATRIDLTTADISAGGVRLIGDTLPSTQFEVGCNIALRIAFEDSIVKVMGRIVSAIVRGPDKGISIEFQFRARDEAEAMRQRAHALANASSGP